jgi:hypothetical protein
MLINCNGMIRSGSTLQYNIIRSILDYSGMDYELLGYLNSETIELEKKSLITYIHDDSKIYLLKTHDYTFLNNENTMTIYSFRDIRDVAASAKKIFLYENDVLVDAIGSAIEQQKKISKSKNILVLRYEAMMNSLEDTTTIICKFLNIECDNNCKGFVTTRNSIAAIQNIQRRGAFVKKIKPRLLSLLTSIRFLKLIVNKKLITKVRHILYPHDSLTLIHNKHISDTAGSSGTWGVILSEYELNTISKKFGYWLKDNQYD